MTEAPWRTISPTSACAPSWSAGKTVTSMRPSECFFKLSASDSIAVCTASAAVKRMAEAELELLRRGAANRQQRQRSDAKTDGEAKPRGNHRHDAFLPDFVADRPLMATAATKL